MKVTKAADEIYCETFLGPFFFFFNSGNELNMKPRQFIGDNLCSESNNYLGTDNGSVIYTTYSIQMNVVLLSQQQNNKFIS